MGETDKRPRRGKAEVTGDGARLRPYVDQIVALEQQRRDLAADIKTVYGAVETAQFMAKAVREIVKRELEDVEKRAARQALETEIDRLTAALGAFVTTPLGEFAVSGTMQ